MLVLRVLLTCAVVAARMQMLVLRVLSTCTAAVGPCTVHVDEQIDNVNALSA